MVRRILDKLPLIFVLALLITYLLAFFLSGKFDGPGTTGEIIFRVAVYLPYAVAVVALAIGYVKLCKRSRDGKVSVWLASVTCEGISFAITMCGILALVLLNFVLPQLEGSELLKQASYALVAGGGAGALLSAVVFWVGWFTGNLDYRIYPWMRRKRGE